VPLPACLFARAYRCGRFRGEAAFGKDTLLRQTFYGFRVHLRVAWPGVITRLCVAPANAHELSVLFELVELTSGIIVGNRNYHSPKTKEELARSMAVELLARYSSKWSMVGEGHPDGVKMEPPPKLFSQQKRDPDPPKERLPQPASLPDRHRLLAADRTLLRKAGVGKRSLASGK
jgi:hypothetical protein